VIGSTRLAIVRSALDDVLARLAEIPSTKDTRGLRVRAITYEHALSRWQTAPPSAFQREALLKVVLELHVEVMRAARGA
jgi:hypothetical protein